MLDSIVQHMSEILSFLGGLVSGSLLTFHFTRQNRVRGSGSVVDQSSSKAGGDIVGGNKTTSARR
jgi:hypothetical protein